MTKETTEQFLGRMRALPFRFWDAEDANRLLALALRGAETQWRPIEEAPKEEGKFYLGWNGHWRGVIQYFVPAYLDDPEWVDETTEFIEPPPTHFIPLTALGEPTPQPMEKVKG